MAKRIGVLTSGGDAPGMNSAIAAVVDTANSMGIECVGIRRGYSGLINNDIFPLDLEFVSAIGSRGGTALYTARSEEFKTPEGLKRAADNCKFMGIDSLVAIGGDGTFRGALALSKHGVSVVAIPGTIDNDIPCTEYTIGFDTACNTAIEMVDKLRDTMKSHERCSVVEVMGHRSGNLALNVGIACSAAAVLIPEHNIDFKNDVIEKIRSARLRGGTHFTVIVAEGAASGNEIGQKILEETGIDTRVTVLGHVQRGGSPNAHDRISAALMGYHAVKVLASGGTNRVICLRDGKYVDMDITEALDIPYRVCEEHLLALEAIGSGV